MAISYKDADEVATRLLRSISKIRDNPDITNHQMAMRIANSLKGASRNKSFMGTMDKVKGAIEEATRHRERYDHYYEKRVKK